MTWNDPNLKDATKEEIAQYREITGKAGLLALGGLGGAVIAEGATVAAPYLLSNPEVATGIGGFLWGLGTDEDMPGKLDDAGRLTRLSTKAVVEKEEVETVVEGAVKGGKFSEIPKASELRSWAKSKNYELLSKKNGIESWGINGEWRLKLKKPSTTSGIHPNSQKWRFSARTKSGEYYNPVTGKTGTRSELGHLDLDPK